MPTKALQHCSHIIKPFDFLVELFVEFCEQQLLKGWNEVTVLLDAEPSDGICEGRTVEERRVVLLIVVKINEEDAYRNLRDGERRVQHTLPRRSGAGSRCWI